ncbi:MAG: proteasome assembly chaperone family protein [Nocardioides sp.]
MSKLVHIIDDSDDAHGLPMVVVLDGFLDAGNAAALAAQTLVAKSPVAPVVATFDVDQFHDYRARRPAVSFVQDHYEAYDAPRLVVRRLTDMRGFPFLLLHGPEPDNRWEAFAAAVKHVVRKLDVGLVISMGSVPMAVPHTRPLTVTQHANNPELITVKSPWRGEIRVPSNAAALLEVRLGEAGIDAVGFVAHIPHYLAQLDYPLAAEELLKRIEEPTELTLDRTGLTSEAASRSIEITEYLGENEEVAEIVAALERQYDTFTRSEESGGNLLAPNEPLPTGDELGQEFERFLASLDDGNGGETKGE